MILSDFGERFRGYSGITHLMDDLSEGLAQPGVVMLGGGNPASIPEVKAVIQRILDELQQSGDLLETLANYDGPQGKTSFLETLADYFRRQYGWDVSGKNIALTHGSQSSFFILFNSFAGRSGGVDKRVIARGPEAIDAHLREMIAWHFAASVVMGFSVMTSQPSSIARITYWSWVLSTVVTITVSGFVSAII